MIQAAATKLYTPADLLAMPDGKHYELIDGELVEKIMSTWSSYVAGRMYVRVEAFCETKPQGWVFPEGTSYQCFPHAPQRVRRADTSFVSLTRLSAAQVTAEGHLSIAPDLAVEVISPNDLASEVNAKVRDYKRAGVRLVWVVDPEARHVQVHRLNGNGSILDEGSDLDGEDVLPGFRCRVADLFQLPPGVTPPA